MIVWLLIIIIGMAFFSYILVSGIESLADILNLKDYVFMLIVFPIFSSLPDLVIIVLNLIYGGTFGPGMALSAAVGEPFMAIVIGIPVTLILGLVKFGRNDLNLFNDSKEIINRVLYVPIIVSIFAYLTIIFLAKVYAIITLAVITIIVFYVYIKNLKNMVFEHVKKIPTLLVASYIIIGFVGYVIFGKLLVESVIKISLMTKISPYGQSFIIFPLLAAIPEFFASSSLILKGKKEAAVASLLGEIVITATLYPALILALVGPMLTFPIILGMGLEIVSAIATIVVSLKTSMIYLVPFDLVMILLYIVLVL
ncbi:MAG: hypothetical protein QXK57_06325 [Conexivisphaerales archaeon]